MPRRRNSISEQFTVHTIRMLESPAWRALSLSAHRVLARVEIELGHHGGHDNGKLPITFDDFERYGIHRHAIGPAISEAEALGFLVVTERGRAGNAEFRTPNKFRLTYAFAVKVPATDDWQHIKTDEEAMALARAARRAPRKQNPSGGKRQVSVSETTTENQNPQWRIPPLQS